MELSDKFYKPINSEESYNREKFVESFGEFSDLENYIQGLIKTPNNPTILSDLGALLRKKPGFYQNMPNPAGVARTEADRAYSSGIEQIAKYVEKNKEKFFNLLDEEKILGLVTNLPLYKTGDKKHDEFIEKLNEIHIINEAEKDASKMHQYVNSKINEIPEWAREAYTLLQGNQNYVQATFQEFKEVAQIRFQKEILTKKGKPDKAKLENIIKNSLKKAWEKYNDEDNLEDKKDIWEGDIRPYYLTLAKMVYADEKKQAKYDKDPAKENRKEDRRKIGMGN